VGGGTNQLSVGANCAWTASSAASWLNLQTPIAGVGNGAINLIAAPNPDVLPRTSSVTVNGQTLQIVQKGAGASPFADVPATHPFVDMVSLMAQYGITSGCSGGNYCPDASTTRGQVAVFIVRSLFGGDQFPYPATPFFTDVPTTHPFFRHIQKLRDLGITAGCTATTYCPDNLVTRGQMAVFLIRARLGVGSASAFPFPPDAAFTDVPFNHPFFPFIQKMRQLSITSGCSATTYVQMMQQRAGRWQYSSSVRFLHNKSQ